MKMINISIKLWHVVIEIFTFTCKLVLFETCWKFGACDLCWKFCKILYVKIL